MKITSIEVYKSPVRLKKPFVISLGSHDHALNNIVIIRTDEGISGSGECSAFMTINGESMETCFVVGQYLGRVLIGKDPLDIEGCIMMMDSVIFGNNSIKSAFDMALYDIASKYAGKPLYEFLGGRRGKEIFTDYTVSIGDPVQMALDAAEIKARGFRVIKVKLGGSEEEDVERIRRIREAVGDEIPLRVDANQGWKKEEVPGILEKLSSFNIQHCEEPINRKEFMQLPAIRKGSPIPIMGDESCCDHYDAERLALMGACDLFNVKLGKSGGICEGLKIVAVAEKYDMGIQLGGFLESRFAFTAAAHFALVSDQIRYFDFDTPLMFSEDPVEDGIQYDGRGVISFSDVPGIGAGFRADHLARCERMVIS